MMKKIFFAFMITVMISVLSVCALAEGWLCPNCSAQATGNFCAQCGAAMPEDTGSQLTLQVSMEENLILSKYDVDVYLNDQKVAEIDHGESLSQAFSVTPGDVVLIFRSQEDTSVMGKISLMVTGDTTLSCHLQAKRDKVLIENVETTALLSDTRLTLGEGGKVDNGQVTLCAVSFLTDPATGSQVARCTFECTNNTSDQHTYLLSFTHTARLSTGTPAPAVSPLKEASQHAGMLDAWDTATVDVYISLPQDWAEVELVCTGGLLQNNSITYVIPNS
ncbi:MAG: hypothetical protein IJB69_02730 [Clostridia bacterium]|nr:hypothetical protein [Clostridia bacterium]